MQMLIVKRICRMGVCWAVQAKARGQKSSGVRSAQIYGEGSKVSAGLWIENSPIEKASYGSESGDFQEHCKLPEATPEA